MTALTSLGLFIFAVICYAVRELHYHGKFKWHQSPSDFWGFHSSIRKYKYINGVIQPAPNNFYYRFFKISYKERFPGAATILVSATDGQHLLQLIFKILIIGSLVSYKEMVNPLVDGLIYFGIWQVVFNVVYRELSK